MAEILKGLKLKKKAIVAISVLVFVVGLMFLLSFTVFSLKTVEVDFRTSHSQITATKEEIVESAGFAKGGSVFFHGKKEYKKKIEDFNPYIKVVNIETVFPSKFVVHISERQQIYAIPFEEGHYICDEELRVLEIQENFESTSSNAILIEPISPVKNNFKVGEYIKNVDIPKIYQAFFENNRTLAQQTELVKSVRVTSEFSAVLNKQQTVATFKLFSGQTVRVVDTEKGLTSKIKLLIDVHSQLFEFIGKTLTTPEGDVVLTEEHLKTCTIEINSYLHPSHGKDECYFDIILN